MLSLVSLPSHIPHIHLRIFHLTHLPLSRSPSLPSCSFILCTCSSHPMTTLSSLALMMSCARIMRNPHRRAYLCRTFSCIALNPSLTHSLPCHLPCRFHPLGAIYAVHAFVRSINRCCNFSTAPTSISLCNLSSLSQSSSHAGTAPPINW